LSVAPNALQSFSFYSPRHTFERISDPLNNLVDLSDNLVIPKPQYLVSRTTQKLTSTFVPIRLIGVLRAINLDDQLRFEANEVREKAPYGKLPSELKSLHLVAAQSRP